MGLRHQHRPMKFFGKFFWWSGALATFLVISLLVGIDEWSSRNELTQAETRTSSHLAQTFGNALSPELIAYLREARALGTLQMSFRPEQAALNSLMEALMRDQSVLQLRILNASTGKILFSNDYSQLAMTGGGTEGFAQASSGRTYLDLSRHALYESADGPLRNRDIASSLTPVLLASEKSGATPSRVVIELHRDVTPHMKSYRTGRLTFAIGTISTLALSFVMMYMFSNRQAKSLAQAEQARRAHEIRIHHLAYHDVLTGLPNRARFMERLQESVTLRRGESLGILFIDLDRLKIVNDSLGHLAGDKVLADVSRRMRAVLDAHDQFYRIGGDEFVVLHKGSDLADLQTLAHDLLTVVLPPFDVEGGCVTLTVSVGIAQWPDADPELEQAVRCADVAMHAAKRAGNSQLAVYKPEMKAELDAEARLMSDLQQAVENGEFVLHYQPRVNAVTLEIESVEALLRWQHPERGLLYPDKFIRELEDSPLIVEAGRWVLEEACKQAVVWRDRGIEGLRMSVNVAPRQFRSSGFLASVREVLGQTGMLATDLELELTESQLIGDLERVVTVLKELQAIGVSVAIDDFGTGYSSLSYLHKLPINCLKIDRSFVLLVSEENNRGDIARSIAMLAHNLGLFVVAEGVETEAQAEVLAGWGCEQLQGYLFSKPLPEAAVTDLILKDRARWRDEQWGTEPAGSGDALQAGKRVRGPVQSSASPQASSRRPVPLAG